MNSIHILDLVVGLLVLWSLFNGWRRGVVLQISALAGIALGVWLGVRFGGDVGRVLGLDPEVATAGGFLAVLVVVLIAVAIAARLLRRLFHFAGLGAPERIAGMALSVVKTLLIVSLLLTAFDAFNRESHFVPDDKLAGSLCYRPLVGLTDRLLPVVDWAKEQVEELK